jgi:protein-tyrosine phosphatase
MTSMANKSVEQETARHPLISNFRDAGGAGLNLGQMHRGRLYRSAAPGRLNATDIDAFRSLGVATIVDLRGLQEAALAPTHIPDGSGIMVVQMPVEPRTSGLVRQALADGSAHPDLMRDLMIQSYRHYVGDSAPAFGEALTALLTVQAPALVHCTAGKDRTGFVIAVIQSALGVSDDDIMADYLRTNTDWDRASASAHLKGGSAAVGPILVADADYLGAAFDEIARRDGSAIDFIQRATQGRVTSAHIDRLVQHGN